MADNPAGEPTRALHAAVNSYLASLQAAAEAMAQACPPVGGPYRQRMARLRSRVAFDSNPEALEESAAIVSDVFREYAKEASGYAERRWTELRRGFSTLEEIGTSLARRQAFYGARLREFAAEMESMARAEEAGNDSGAMTEAVRLQVAGLLSCLESMGHESESLVKRMHGEIEEMERRLAEAEVTDPVTGLLNRREMERRIEKLRAGGSDSPLIQFVFPFPLPDEAAQQIAGRLGSQFRYKDVISRWSDREFLVMFAGSVEIARMRAEQIVPWIAGRYLLDNGSTLELEVEAALVHMDPVEPAAAHTV